VVQHPAKPFATLDRSAACDLKFILHDELVAQALMVPLAEDTVLFLEVVDDISLLLVHPAAREIRSSRKESKVGRIGRGYHVEGAKGQRNSLLNHLR